VNGGLDELGWAAHAGKCARCRTVDLQRTATVANACLTGAQLLKGALASLMRRRVEGALMRELEAEIARSAELTSQTIAKARAS
jgi:hypothetical protein